MIKIMNTKEVSLSDILKRENPADTPEIESAVRAIIADVRKNGDSAVLDYTERFDGAKLKSLLVSKEETISAVSSVDDAFTDILTKASVNITGFHKKQVRQGFMISEKKGVVTGQRILPLERVGIYVPGGTAAYPSTVLMNAVPAKIAGVKEIIMATPPDKNGNIDPAILMAAYLADVDKIYKMGGAQAIAALAYGTESVPRVDKIVGPGNAYVAEAKRQVYGTVAIDMIAGPSEILVIADEKSDARCIAADLLSQAEHDGMAAAVLITTSEKLAEDVAKETERQLPLLPRQETARASIDKNGRIIITETIEEAIDISNALAPEHLELCVDDPFGILPLVKNAGSVFMGRYCPEALGDYFAGPNHTLPTSGTARFSSPLSVDDFIKKMQYTYYTKDALSRVARDVASFAEKEGLSAHARSAMARGDEN